MKQVRRITTLLALAVIPAISNAQATAPVYVVVDCMKPASHGYLQLELDIWKPVHQHLVDEGMQRSWALYEVVFGDRSQCDYYTVTTFDGHPNPKPHSVYDDAFSAVHPNVDVGELMIRTVEARSRTSTELWVLLDQTEMQPHHYAVVNKMHAADPVAYERMESEVFKAGHEVLIENGERAGWAVYALISPIGSSIPYNYGTVDFVNDLGPVPMAEAMLAGNPGRDLDAMHELLRLRDHVLSETWRLVGATEPRTD